jgi:hypothetical protein
LWEVHIAARDYAGAAALLEAWQANGSQSAAWRFLSASEPDEARIITDHFLGAEDDLGPRLVAIRARLDRERQEGLNSENDYRLSMAFITAIEGDTAESERLVRAWLREAVLDLAELANMRHHACRALGLAAAASAAVECLRSGLAEPSLVMPFIEPFLPYYDSVRNDPGFIEFLAEIEGA